MANLTDAYDSMNECFEIYRLREFDTFGWSAYRAYLASFWLAFRDSFASSYEPGYDSVLVPTTFYDYLRFLLHYLGATVFWIVGLAVALVVGVLASRLYWLFGSIFIYLLQVYFRIMVAAYRFLLYLSFLLMALSYAAFAVGFLQHAHSKYMHSVVSQKRGRWWPVFFSSAYVLSLFLFRYVRVGWLGEFQETAEVAVLMATLILVVPSVFPESTELVEEMATHLTPHGKYIRLLMILIESLHKNVNGVRYEYILVSGTMHLIYQVLPFGFSALLHFTWNFTVSRVAVSREHHDYQLLNLLHATPVAEEQRTYDMAVGNAEYDNEIFDAELRTINEWEFRLYYTLDTYLTVPVGGTVHTLRRPFSPELYNHCMSLRCGVSALDTPALIRERVVGIARSFTQLSVNRMTLASGWQHYTVEFAIATLVGLARDSLREATSADAGPVHLYGYTAESINVRLAATNPIDIFTSKPLNLDSRHAAIGGSWVPRPVAVQLFASPTAIPPKADPYDRLNLLMGVSRRVAKTMPVADPARMERFAHFCQQYFAATLSPLPADSSMDVEDWLSKTSYSDARKDELRRVAREMVAYKRKHQKAKSFGKDEHLADYKTIRIISSRSDAHKVTVGPMIKAVEKVVFGAWPEVIKKIPLPERPKYISEIFSSLEGLIYETDYRSYEATHTPAFVLACYFHLLLHMLQNHSDGLRRMRIHLAARFGKQILNFADFQVVLFLAILLSGEMDTSLNNTVANKMACLFLCSENAQRARVPFDVYRTHGVFEGDDGLAKLNPLIAPTALDFASIGADCEVQIRTDISSSTFCGICFDEVDLAPLTDIRDALGTFAWSHTPDSNAALRRRTELLIAKAYSYAYQYPGCPVLYPMACSILRRFTHDPLHISKFIQNNGIYDQWTKDMMLSAVKWHTTHPEVAVGVRSRAFVERMFGVTCDEQARLELFLSTADASSFYDVSYSTPASWNHFFANHVRTRSIALNRSGPLASLFHGFHNPMTHSLHTFLRGLIAPPVFWILFVSILLSIFLFSPAVRLPQFTQVYRELMNVKQNKFNGATARLQTPSSNSAEKAQTSPSDAYAAFRQRLASKGTHEPSAGLKSLADRAGRIARALESTQKVGDRHPSGQSRPGAGERSGELVRLDGRAGKAVRPDAIKSNPGNRGSFVRLEPVLLRNSEGVHVARIDRFAGTPRPLAVAPLNTSESRYTSSHSEYETVDKRGRVVRAQGHMMLDDISTGISALIPGQRLSACLLHPAAIGGPLALLARTFTQHKAHKCVIDFCSSVPATQAGAIALSYTDDLVSPQVNIGADELRHASTRSAFVQSNVWTSSRLEINPTNLTSKYTTGLGGPPTSSIQGLLLVESASVLPASTTFGNLYIHYDFEFFSPQLEDDEALVGTPNMILNWNNATPASLAGSQYFFPCATTAASGTPFWQVNNVPSGFTARNFLYGIVTTIAGTGSSPTFTTPLDGSVNDFRPGQLFFFAFDVLETGSNNFTNGSIFAGMFTTMPSGTENGATIVTGSSSTDTTLSARNLPISTRAIPYDI